MPADIRECRAGSRLCLEAEVRRVEVDGAGDVVDHVANIDGVLDGHELLLLASEASALIWAIKNSIVLDLVSGANEARVVVPGSAEGSAMSRRSCRWPWRSGQTSRTRSHSVTTWSNRAREPAEALGGPTR